MTLRLRRECESPAVGVARGWFVVGAAWGALMVLFVERIL